MTCHFFEIPIEIRCRVYQYLLPDKAIPSRFVTFRCLTTDGGQVNTAILRVNHQVHEEAAHLLYCTRVFAIEVSNNNLSICDLQNRYVRFSFYSTVTRCKIGYS
jgi:hypothetical protein